LFCCFLSLFCFAAFYHFTLFIILRFLSLYAFFLRKKAAKQKSDKKQQNKKVKKKKSVKVKKKKSVKVIKSSKAKKVF
jgi:flagellar biosynthesis component FlhA